MLDELLRLWQNAIAIDRASHGQRQQTTGTPAGECESIMSKDFTDDANEVLRLAKEEAQRLNHASVDTEHLLLGLIRVRSGVAVKVFKNLDINRRKIRLEVLKRTNFSSDVSTASDRPLTASAQVAINYAIEEAAQNDDECVETDHILVGLFREQHGIAWQVLYHLGLELGELREEIQEILERLEVEE